MAQSAATPWIVWFDSAPPGRRCWGAWTLPRATRRRPLAAPGAKALTRAPSIYPADLSFLEGFRPAPRAWFQKQAAHVGAVNGQAPYKRVLHPWLSPFDEKVARMRQIPGNGGSIPAVIVRRPHEKQARLSAPMFACGVGEFGGLFRRMLPAGAGIQFQTAGRL